ncbi:protein of unknown function [Candidatus Filomicrobium marinum]|uniref:Uncharacterized protein n=1 Tax=Candidatus Filomicrobium marinum TaxID=1608628 RepID=A0A0D6JJE8_9HYPH|nr:protein of unknown function [Candidatus Filomicrobium marinum]CPR22109.1 protein of unknown function [Candidatus Filomicrobium marinum]
MPLTTILVKGGAFGAVAPGQAPAPRSVPFKESH